MANMQKKILIGIGIAIVVILGVYFIFRKRNTEVPTSQMSNATSTQNIPSGIVATGNYKIEQITPQNSVPQPIPDLNRSIHPAGSAAVSPEALALASQKIPIIQAALKKDPSQFSDWLNLAMYQKMAGDYEGTSISWLYASRLAPNDYISLGNLGNLYGYFIKDNTKAINYYNQAIAKGPKLDYLYEQFAEFYRDVMNDKSKAKAIIDEGLIEIPNDPVLLSLKNQLNK